jgi:hypothetical protein
MTTHNIEAKIQDKTQIGAQRDWFPSCKIIALRSTRCVGGWVQSSKQTDVEELRSCAGTRPPAETRPVPLLRTLFDITTGRIWEWYWIPNFTCETNGCWCLESNFFYQMTKTDTKTQKNLIDYHPAQKKMFSSSNS